LLRSLEQFGSDVEGYTTYRRYSCEMCGGIMEITETEDVPAVCSTCGHDFRAHPESQKFVETAEVIRMELRAVRPDMFDPGGLARLLRGYFDKEVGLLTIAFAPLREVAVDASLAEEGSYRPCIACAIVKNVHLDTEFIRIVMKLQENLHWAMGRNRKHASIGVYDLDTVQGNFKYVSLDPDGQNLLRLG